MHAEHTQMWTFLTHWILTILQELLFYETVEESEPIVALEMQRKILELLHTWTFSVTPSKDSSMEGKDQ